MRLTFSITIFFLSLVFLTGCKKDELEELTAFPDGAYKCTTDWNGAVASLSNIDGDMPYYSVDIDSENWSRITDGTLIMRNDGTWSSTLFNEREVDGVYEEEVITRSGQYRCVDVGELFLVNDQNQEAGILTEIIDPSYFNSGQVVYRVKLESSAATYNYMLIVD